MWIAYFDESGTHADSGAFCLAGLVASADQWMKLEAEWKAVLLDAGVSNLHMKHFEHRIHEFAGWSKETHTAFIAKLASIIVENVPLAVSASVVLADFRQMSEIAKVYGDDPRFQEPFILCLRTCLDEVIKNVDAFGLPKGERIACVFDRNEGMRGQATNYYFSVIERKGWGQFFHGISFESRLDFVPLQAADILAYESYKHMHNWALGNRRDLPTRKLITRLDHGIHVASHRLHRDTDLLTLIGATYWAPPHMRRD